MLADIAARLPVITGSYTLADNTAAWTNIPTHAGWDATTIAGVSLVYAITRGGNPEVEVGNMSIAIRSAAVAEGPLYVDSVTTTSETGVALRGNVSAGTVKIQYTSTSTGSDANLQIIEIKRWPVP
jgi:hypothetical protein